MMLSRHLLSKRSMLTKPIRSFASGTHLEKFDWEDPLKLSNLLSDEEIMIQDTA